MNRREVEGAIVGYCHAVLGSQAEGRIIRARESGPRPAMPYIAIEATTDAEISSPLQTTYADDTEEAAEDRIVTVTVHIFGRQALDLQWAELLCGSRALYPGQTLTESGISIIRTEAIGDISARRDVSTVIERHFVVDFICLIKRKTRIAAVTAETIEIEAVTDSQTQTIIIPAT